MIYFGTKLKQLREERGLTQKELAKGMELSPSMISMYEGGGSYPSVEILIRLSHYFRVSTDYLLGVSDSNGYDFSGRAEVRARALTFFLRKQVSLFGRKSHIIKVTAFGEGRI